MKLKQLLLTTCAMLFVTLAFSQNRVSPKQTATGKIGSATVTVNYSSPAVKGRKIWGGLVPYDTVWRAGANEATIFETDKDLMIEGKRLPAGKYSLYVLPHANSWDFIFNSQTGQWGIKRDGSTTRVPANDVLIAKVKPGKSAMTESLTYEVTKKGLTLKWDNLAGSVNIKEAKGKKTAQLVE